MEQNFKYLFAFDRVPVFRCRINVKSQVLQMVSPACNHTFSLNTCWIQSFSGAAYCIHQGFICRTLYVVCFISVLTGRDSVVWVMTRFGGQPCQGFLSLQLTTCILSTLLVAATDEWRLPATKGRRETYRLQNGLRNGEFCFPECQTVRVCKCQHL